jgi:hypothetical protein
LVPTLQSISLARAAAATKGIEVDIVVVLDRPDNLTTNLIRSYSSDFHAVHEVAYGDLGKSREFGIASTRTEHVFLHDGDDLFSENWYWSFAVNLARGNFDPRAVYHTDLFIGFGEQRFFRQMIGSSDPNFDPLYLASEWYFSNKCVLPKSLLEEFPLPYNDIKAGVGNEDWSWSCNTIAAGIRHEIVPYTICFYRLKPAADSLGLTPGMIHHRSPLFDPEHVRDTYRRLSQHGPVGRAAINAATAIEIKNLAAEVYPPEWVWNETKKQAIFEPLLTDLYSMPAAEKRLRPPRLSSNVSWAYRKICENLRSTNTILLFLSEDNIRGADYFIEKVVESARLHFGEEVQIIVVLDEKSFSVVSGYFWDRYNAKVVSVSQLRTVDRLEDWYLYRFLMRLFMQFQPFMVVDFCSDTFTRMFDEFNRGICTVSEEIRFVYPNLVADLGSRTLSNLRSNVNKYITHKQISPRVLSLADLSEIGGVASDDVRVLDEQAEKWRQMLLRRFSNNECERVEMLRSVDFGAMFAALPAVETPIANNQAHRTGYTAEGIRVVLSRQAWGDPSLVKMARDFFWHHPTVNILIPQIVILQNEAAHNFAYWIDATPANEAFSALIDLAIMQRHEAAFFVAVRIGSKADKFISEFLKRSECPTGIELVLLIKRNFTGGGICALPGSICFSLTWEKLGAAVLDEVINVGS